MNWLSVKDALPPKQMWVLVTTYGGEYGTDLGTWWALYKEGKFYDVLDAPKFDTELEVVGWMAPPDPMEVT